MPKKPVFMMARRGAEPLPTKYDPLIYTRQTSVWRLALHKSARQWIVSDPASGAKICAVTALYKGLPVASRDLTLKQARLHALADLDALVDRVGFDRFAAVLADPKPR